MADSTDGDELPDVWEIKYFTNLTRTGLSDQDTDGLLDPEEYLHGTDPLKVDSDGDGYTDGEEVEFGSNPLAASSTPVLHLSVGRGASSSVALSWNGFEYQRFQPQINETLEEAGWRNVGEECVFIGAGEPLGLDLPMEDSACFYRLAVNEVNPCAHLESLLNEIETGSRKNVRIATFGDSLGNRAASQFVYEVLLPHYPLKLSFQSGFNVDYNSANGFKGHASTSFLQEDVAMLHIKEDYQYSFSGTYFEVDANSANADILFAANRSGTPMTCGKILVPLIKGPGEGTVTVTLDGADELLQVETSSLSPVISGLEYTLDLGSSPERGMEVLTITYNSLGAHVVKVTAESGVVHCLGPTFMDNEYTTSATFLSDCQSSNSFGNASEDAIDLWATYLGHYRPDLVFVQSDDEKECYELFLPMLKTVIEKADLDYAPTVLLVTNFDESTRSFKDRAVLEKAFAYQECWSLMDLNSTLSNSELIAKNWGGDGTHRHLGAYRSAAYHWALARGFISEEDTILHRSVTLNPSLLQPGGFMTTQVMVNGAPTSLATAQVSPESVGGLEATVDIVSTNLVRLTLTNNSGISVNLPLQTFAITVVKEYQ